MFLTGEYTADPVEGVTGLLKDLTGTVGLLVPRIAVSAVSSRRRQNFASENKVKIEISVTRKADIRKISRREINSKMIAPPN